MPVVPPLPEAASFFKSTDIPISHYTGLPNINIPLYTIKTRELQIPVGLNYNARGILVAEIASRTGIGWALQYGGMISRQIRGTPDDEAYGILNSDYYNEIFTSQTVQSDLNTDIVNHNADQVPDQFYFNVNTESGKFIIDFNDRKVLLQKFGDLEIEPNTAYSKITSWIATDKWGNKFYYGKSKDGSREANDYNYSSQNYFFGQLSGLTITNNNDDRWITTWHLMEIDTYLKEKIEFFYEREEGYQYRRSHDEWYQEVETGFQELRCNFSYDKNYQYQISQIRFPGGSVFFESDVNERKDYKNTHALRKLVVKDRMSDIVKEYEFSYFYQRCIDDDNQLNYLKLVDTSAKYRLFLSSIKESNEYGDTLPPYKFEYSSALLPNRFSNSQDNWGFYNGKDNGSFLTFNNHGTPNNRVVDTALSGAGLLKKITYTTGGYSEFFYEQNRIMPLPFIDSLLYNPNNPTEESVVGDAFYKDSIYYENGLYSKVITIGQDLKPNTNVMFSFVPPFVPPGADSSIIYYQVKLAGEGNTIYLYPPDTERELNLNPGTYTLKVIPTGATDPNNPYRAFIAGLSWIILDENADSLPPDEWYGAGKRIHKIEHWNDTSLASVKEYEYLNDSAQTSGLMIGLPNYFWISQSIPGLGPVVEGYWSEPGSPLSQIQGNSLGYSRVTEYLGTRLNNSGKIVYEFTVDPDGGEYYRMPYHLPVDYEWIRGKPLTTKIYKTNGGSYELQKSIENTYLYAGNSSNANIFSQPFLHMDSVYVYRKDRNLYYLPLFTFAPCEEFHVDSPLCFKVYYQSGGSADLAATTEKLYSNGQVLTSVSEYGYNYQNHYQPTTQKRWTSKGDTVITTSVYPLGLISKTSAEQKLIDAHRIAAPVKTETITENSSDIQLAKTIKNIVNKNWGNDLVLPELVQTAINSEPLITDATFNKYNRFGSPLEITLKSGIKEVYVWGYKKQYPVAKVIGSDYNTVISFIDTTFLDSASKYTDAQLRTELNKIRTGLAGTPAQVITCTYKPLIGISSVTDPQNRSVFYEYDDYGRLTLIRGQDNNILKKICYNYAGQPEDCNCTNFSPIWQNTSTPLRCRIINNKNTGEQEQEQKDLNPCSPGYNQTRWIITGTNLSACPVPVNCSHSNCIGEDRKCINGICETGIKIFTASYSEGSRSYCVYHYEWSDGSWSMDITEEVPFGMMCAI